MKGSRNDIVDKIPLIVTKWLYNTKFIMNYIIIDLKALQKCTKGYDFQNKESLIYARIIKQEAKSI